MQYREYIELISQLLPGSKINHQWYLFFMRVWARLWDFKPGFFSEPSLRLMCLQLLTACRYAALPDLRTHIVDTNLVIEVPAVKSGRPYQVVFNNPPAPLTDLLSSRRTGAYRLSYFGYRRELLSANPNFFFSLPPGIAGSTHIFRYYAIQVLHYVCMFSLAQLSERLGWRKTDSIESYIDSKIWLSE